MISIQKKIQTKSSYAFKKNSPIKFNKAVTIVTNKKDFKLFYQIPWRIYKNNPYWIPPFWMEYNNFFNTHNPFWNHAESILFVIYKKNQPVGRIAAIIDYLYCQQENKNIGFFGFFECINDYSYAKILLQTAEKWLSSKGMEVMQGPVDGRIDQGCGFLIDGFKMQPSLLSSYTPKYYNSFAKKYNLKKTRDQISYYIDLKKPLPFLLKEKAKQCKQNGITLRQFNRIRANKELDWWIDLFLETFTSHWGFVPVSAEEVKSRFGVKQIRWLIDTSLFLIAERDSKPVAYLWATPDYNQIFKEMNGTFSLFQLIKLFWKKNQINEGKLHLIGIKKEERNHHIASCLNYEILKEMKKRGYIGAEVGWIDEKNTPAHQTISLTGAEYYKKTRVYEKNIV